MQHDILLKGGRVVCPATGLDGVMDVAITAGRIAAVQPDILPSAARQVALDVRGRLVLPGRSGVAPAASATLFAPLAPAPVAVPPPPQPPSPTR